jgi:hypothetical protein
MSKFELIGGVGIMGFISPMDTYDTYAVIDPLYGVDGLRNVGTIDDLISISLERRRPGMIVGINGGETYYKLKDSSWNGDITDWTEIDFTKIYHIDKEQPVGVIDGSNATFELTSTPIPNSEHIYLNGLLQDSGVYEDYVINGNVITFNDAPFPGMKIRCSYRTI